MAYIVGEDFTEQLYSGESIFRATLKINDVTIPNDQIASISISSPIIDDSKQVFYIGSFISQKITIKFKNMDNIAVESGQEVSLSIGQYVLDELDPESSEWVDVPIGKFIVDDLAEDYYDKCEISCLDYAIKFKPNVDYSECFTNGKATIGTILQYVCEHCGVLLGDYPKINDDVEIGTYDSTVSGKQWISYIAEIKGCNAKIDREGKLTLQPLKQPSKVPINALESASFETGERFKISKVTYFDAIRNFTFGNDTDNTLFIRQDNPFINDENVVKNIYESIVNEKQNATGSDLSLDNTDEYNIILNTIYGETSQETYTGKNLLDYNIQYKQGTTTTISGVTVTFNDDGSITLNGTMNENNIQITGGDNTLKLNVDNTKTYYSLVKVISGSYTKSGTVSPVIAYDCKYNSGGSTYYRNYTLPTTTNSNQLDVTGTEYITRYRIWQDTSLGKTTFNNFRIQLAVYQGDNTTEWEKYVGGIPSPNPEYPQNVNTVTGKQDIQILSKNLIEPRVESVEISGVTITNNGDGSFTFDGTNTRTSGQDTIRLDQDTKWGTENMKHYSAGTYTLSCNDMPNNMNLIFCDYPNYRTLITMSYNNVPVTVTINDTEFAFFYVIIPAGATYNNVTIHPMCEKNSIATNYEPYQTQEKEIDLGKNLCDITVSDVTINGVRFIKQNDGTVIANGTASEFTGQYEFGRISFPIDTQITYSGAPEGASMSNYSFNLKKIVGSTETWQSDELGDGRTIICEANAIYSVRLVVRKGITVNNIVFKPMIELGNKKTSYAKYYNISKNLFDGQTSSGRWDIIVGNVIAPNDRNGFRNTNPIEIKPNTVYTASASFKSGAYIVETDENNKILAIDGNNGYIPINVAIGTKKTKTITTHNDARYLYWYTTIATDNPSDFMLEESNVYTNYEPYNKHIELYKIGDYQDYITKNTGKNLFDIGIWYNDRADHKWSGSGTFTIAKDGSIISDIPNKMDYYTPSPHMNTTNPTPAQKEMVIKYGLEVKPNTHYTLSFNNPNKCKMQFFRFNYDADCKYISLSNTDIFTDIKRTINITTLENQSYLFFRFDNESYSTTPVRLIISNLQVEEGDTATDYEPYGKDEWYLHKEIGKYVFTGNETLRLQNNGNRVHFPYNANVYDEPLHTLSNGLTYGMFSNKLKEVTANQTWVGTQGVSYDYNSNEKSGNIDISINGISTLEQYKEAIVGLSVNYILAIPTNTKITYQPLIDQLNGVDNLKTYEGKTYITSTGPETNAPIGIDYYTNTNFELYSVKTRNYGDFTLDAWDNIEYDLDGVKYNTLNNNSITYEMTVMSDVDTKIPTKQQTVTTNIIGGDSKVNIKKIKTEVDNLNATATILAEQQDETSHNLASLQVTVNSIQNLFTLTGGNNLIRNSAFLLTDAVWTFTDNGNNPYHTALGNSYNSTVAGKTVSISEIKLRNVKVKSTTDNITGLKNDGTRYTLNFYYKQDANTTTTIKLYDTNNTSVKAFDDIVLTGEKDFTNYEIAFVPSSSNYTLEIIVSSTANGYLYLYDLMLNSGDKQPWQPAPDEIYSTTLTMSRQGLKVYSVGDGTITLLGSDGLLSYETSDGKTLGRLVSQRTVDGDKVRSIDTQSIELGQDITNRNVDRWLETTVVISGKLHKISYLESGDE